MKVVWGFFAFIVSIYSVAGSVAGMTEGKYTCHFTDDIHSPEAIEIRLTLLPFGEKKIPFLEVASRGEAISGFALTSTNSKGATLVFLPGSDDSSASELHQHAVIEFEKSGRPAVGCRIQK